MLRYALSKEIDCTQPFLRNSNRKGPLESGPFLKLPSIYRSERFQLIRSPRVVEEELEEDELPPPEGCL